MPTTTCEATANIAVVKYWGKRDEELILPTNSSLSFTMDEQLKTKTTVMFCDSITEDELWLNGQNMDLKNHKNSDYLRPLTLIREQARINAGARIVSYNYFPTAAGFASSASGVAALVYAAVHAAGLNLSAQEISILARRGSGSATRSILGGCVEWQQGEKADGSDSYAVAVAPADHWPELRNVIAVLDSKAKKVGSRAGMKQTVMTSALYQQRLRELPKTMIDMKAAIVAKDFAKFAELTMRESNSMHATMLDTWPAICYLNDLSREVMFAVDDLNTIQQQIVAGYTFDAGPNAHIYTTEQHVALVKEMLEEISGVQKVMVCQIGNGPKLLPESESLIDETGHPRLEESV